MRLFQDSGFNGFDYSRGATFTLIEKWEWSIVRTTYYYIIDFMIEDHSAQRAGRLQSFFRKIGIVQVPNIRVQWHLRGHLLESQNCIRDSYPQISCWIWMPTNLCHSSFYRIWVFEYHGGLSCNILREVLWLLSTEVLFEQINLIILPNALLGSTHQVFGSLSEAKVRISVQLL